LVYSVLSKSKNIYELSNYVVGLQALRGIAVLLVVCSHFYTVVSTDPLFLEVTPLPWINQAFSRGFLGVDIFFVLSGFLITSLLFKESEKNIRSNLKGFYSRRALRILPALYALIIVSFLIAIWEGSSLVYQWNSTWSALLFISNWTFEPFFLQTQDDLGHLWSLAVEEQFYIVWPIVFFTLRRLRIHWSAITFAMAVLVVVIAVYRNSLWSSQVPWLFIYLKTETRSDAILIGCIFAYIFRYVSVSPKLLKTVGYISVILLIAVAYFCSDVEKGFLYQGGFSLIAFLAGMVILAVVLVPSFAGPVVNSRMIIWWGQRSYGIYLWHLPIFRLFGRNEFFGSDFLRIVIATGISLGVAELSWRVIEQPFIRIKNDKFSRLRPTHN
jgi:peptidoglycan/LPS O-acetylase OafA/YrhL